MARLVEQVEKMLRYKAEEKGLCLRVYLGPRVPDVLLGDPYRLTQILLNLGGNAIKFTAQGQVSLDCEVAGYHAGTVLLAFVVRDTGVGIEASYLQSIGQDFSQEDNSITRQFGGTGLGLSICRTLLKLMGSELLIESEKHQGTTVHFTLPLPLGTLADLPILPPAHVSVHALRGKRVLLVEDNEYNRLMAKSFLLNAHLRVTEAEHGQQALERASEQTFDLILMDVQMPVLDGLAATTQLRAQGLRTPIIALTASAIRGEKERCMAAGMDDYLAKPFYEDELLQLLCHWLPSPLSPTQSASSDHSTEIAPSAPPEPKLYNLNVLLEMARGDQNFVSTMLETFLKSTKQALQDIQSALAVGDVTSIQAAAHKLRPSLRHLQIYPTLKLMDRLENWDKPFSYDDIRPLVEATGRELTQVLAAMSAELETRRAK